MHLSLAQAFSNRAPRGRKHDFRDAGRLMRRLAAGELTLIFVPGAEQRAWRTMTRMKVQLTREKCRLQSQLECLLEEMRIKLSRVLSDLFGVSGYRMLRALAQGETDPKKLAALGDDRLKCTDEQLIDALTGSPQPHHLERLALYLGRYDLLAGQLAKLESMIAQAMKAREEAGVRRAALPGFGADSAQQVIAEVGPGAGMFPSAADLTTWVGTCPGEEETAEENPSSRSSKGNQYMRRILHQTAHAAVKKKGSHLQAVFRPLLPRLGYKASIWAIAHRLCRRVWKVLHEGVVFVAHGVELSPRAKRERVRTLVRSLRKLGYEVDLQLITPVIPEAQRPIQLPSTG
jgi:transposase